MLNSILHILEGDAYALLDWLSKWRPIFETLYFLASIGLVASIFLGIKQLKLLKKDMSDRNKRAAIEKAVEYLHDFATDFIPKAGVFRQTVKAVGIPEYQGPYDDHFMYNSQYNLNDSSVKKRVTAFFQNGGISIANELEFFSAAVLSGLADEELIFNPLSTVTLELIEFLYPIYCEERKEPDTRMFTNTIQLYKMWKARINVIEEQKERQRKQDASKLSEKRITPLGM